MGRTDTKNDNYSHFQHRATPFLHKKLKSYVANDCCLVLDTLESRYNKRVSIETSKVLLFITDWPDQLKSVIAFLKKRNYDVHTVSDLKDSVTKIFEIHPQFVFLAWDHNDRKVTTFAKLLGQTTSAPIIPFINKNTKDSILRFGACPLSPKLYPPLSGPAVERLVLKTGIDDRKLVRARDRSAATAEEVRKAKQLLVDSLNQETHDSIELLADGPPVPDEAVIEILAAHNLPEKDLSTQIGSMNERLNLTKGALEQNQIEGFKKNLDDHLKLPLENILANQQEDRAFNGASVAKKSNLIIQKGTPSSMKNSTHLIHRGSNTHKTASTHSEPQLHSAPNFIYCLSLVSEKWCGYFMVSTTTLLDYTQIDLAFADWIKMQMAVGEIDESQYFELHNLETEEWAEIKRHADFTEQMQIQEHHFEICFLRVLPDDMKIQLSEDKAYICVPTEEIPIDIPLDFSLWLHLPENKKYLLYTAQYSPLEDKQKQRLLLNQVDTLFTSLQHEKFYRYFLLKKNLNAVVSSRPQKAAAQ